MILRILKKLTKVNKKQYLPKLSRTLVNETRYDYLELDSETQRLLSLGIARDAHDAQQLLQDYGATDAIDLLHKLPKPKANWKRRLKIWLADLEGGQLSDPHYHELRTNPDDLYTLF